MVEIAAGVVVMAAALWLAASGSGMIMGIGPLAALGGVGVLLCLHGLYRSIRDRREGSRHWLRAQGVHTTILVLALAVAVALPVVAAPLGIFKVAGFPLGYYMAAQGVPILLVALAFLAARAEDRIDIEETADDE